MSDTVITTIQISKNARTMLKKVGRKDETYDDVIIRLIKLSEEKDAGV